MASNGKDSAGGRHGLTDEELEKLAIEELIRESKNQSGSGQKRKRLDVAAHRMVINSLSVSRRPKSSNSGSALKEPQQRPVVDQDQGQKNTSYSSFEEISNSAATAPKRKRHPS